ncbi:hypothetical protein TWF718_000430 [Orbilia javanica]|uniref:F-box domain-containing protein n=1 Tax=Orbilia javanica TaxID=47235 RepID=A0AAN8RRM4_9PEZI
MSPILRLPSELKFELLSSLDSTSDLDSICNTCRDFRNFRTSRHWNAIENSVFKNETTQKLSSELIAISKLRDYKKPHIISAKLGELNGLQTSSPGRCGDLSELIELRRVIRWFAKRFFVHHLALRKDKVPPSASEISRIEHAFGVIWTWMEASYDFTKRKDDIVETICWAIGDDDRYFEYALIAGDLLAVYTFLRGELEHIGVLIAAKQSEGYLEYLGALSTCLDQYLRTGIPNILLMEKGLDEVKEILEAPIEDQLAICNPFFGHLDYTLTDPYAFDVGDDEDVINHFVSIVRQLRGCSSYKDFVSRPLWNGTAYGIYNIQREPWDQEGEFDHMATFWDDERLVRWGYYPSLDYSQPFKKSTYSNLTDKILRAHACGCKDGWGCQYQARNRTEDDDDFSSEEPNSRQPWGWPRAYI